MWDWVGGRTSELSAVGLVPAALQGIDIDAMLAGAAAMRRRHAQPRHAARTPPRCSPSTWYHADRRQGQEGHGRPALQGPAAALLRYLQQLVMESLGKELDLDGNVVHQGIAVYGNKGSTDQHAYVQQLRDGVNNFFVDLHRGPRRPRPAQHFEVEPGVTTGDYLHGFLLGTREALYENDRESITITIPDVDARTVGVLDRPLRARRRLLRLAGQHQRLPPARRRSGQKGCGHLPGNPQQGARPPHRLCQNR